MIKLRFFIRYALNRLRHGGQRVIIAMLAVAFGVMSLISMTSISDAIETAINMPADIQLGGDMRIWHEEGQFTQTQLVALDEMQTEGLISAYTPIHESYMMMMRTESSGEARFVRNLTAVNPAHYPLIGEVALDGGGTLAEHIANSGEAVITQDMAADFDIAVGDTLRFAYIDGMGLQGTLKVTGIVTSTPDQSGQRIIYNLSSLPLIFGNAEQFDYAIIKTDDVSTVAARLSADGWSMRRLDDSTQTSAERDLFNLMLRGAGVLGLIVGGIGIANTMTVLLAQRRQEVGILKTLGYSSRSMLMLFLLEAMLLGAIGSLIGALAALLVSQGITQLFANISTMLIRSTFNPTLTLTGIFIGIGTTVLFALQAIVRTSRIRPTVIFRHEPVVSGGWRGRLETLAFYALLSIPFAGITTIIMGSPIDGIGILIFALGGLIGFGIVLSIASWVILRVLPVVRFNLLKMARNNMRKRAGAMLFAMIALTVGIFTMGFALTIVQVGFDQFGARQGDGSGPTLQIYTNMADMPRIEQALASATDIQRHYILHDVDFAISDQFNYSGASLHSRDRMWDVDIIEGPPLTPAVAGAYVSDGWPVGIGDTLSITLTDGTTRNLPIIGRYATHPATNLTSQQHFPIVSLNVLRELGEPQVNLYATTENAAAIARDIGQAFPSAMTLTSDGMTQEIHRTFMNLLGFSLAMSGLALLAGVMLSANVVSLAMIERRAEIGVMKAVGYSQRHILTVIALEYGLIGLIASLVGLVGVQIMVMLLTMTQAGAVGLLFVSPTTALIVLAAGLSLTILTALASAWEPTKVRPLVVLNARAS